VSSLKEFGKLISSIEDEREKVVSDLVTFIALITAFILCLLS